ncbi:MAG: TauD/TfdA family dioxygenase, partial [Pseudomonadota bacterium]|nr:TauD/TfdA family dioxygenase [Pseudomonadota bacterium]
EDPFIEPVSLDTPVIEIKRAKDESTPIFGGDWHSDWSFQAKPPRFTFLYGHVVPPEGGRTIFADCVRAHRSLPEVTKAQVTGLEAIHSARRAYGPFGLFAKDGSSRSMKIKVSESAEKTIAHPMVRSIKELGEGAIFVNPVYTVGIKGLSSQESADLLKDVSEYITDEAFQLPISWSQGTLVIWDNRTVIHFAEGGYEGHERVMFRMTIGKERPVPQKELKIKKVEFN